MTQTLSPALRNEILEAIRSLRLACGGTPDHPEPLYPREVHDLDAHLLDLVRIARTGCGGLPEPQSLVPALCAACPFEYPQWYCPLQAGGCTFRREGAQIIQAVADVLRRHDANVH